VEPNENQRVRGVHGEEEQERTAHRPAKEEDELRRQLLAEEEDELRRELLGESVPVASAACVFPFAYAGEVYRQCATVSRNHHGNVDTTASSLRRSWCATAVDAGGAATTWEYCRPTCDSGDCPFLQPHALGK
jgi:hypothetical protein